MECERLAGVTGLGGPGSGYVVAPRLVLTSAHVVGQWGAVAMVFRPGSVGHYVGHVVWYGRPGGRDDAALIAIDDPGWVPLEGAVRWGKSVTHRPGLRCKCLGVPDVMQRPGHAADTAQLIGTINPGDGMVSDRYLIRLDGHPPATSADGRSPWGGLSGAAVFCEDLLLGVIATDPASFGHSVLEAVPAYVLHHDLEFRAVLADHAPVIVIEGAEMAALASPEAGPHPQGAVVSPAELLTARRAVVGFRGRGELLKQLRTWARQPGVGVCLVHGPGGQGKTRLARHFGEQFAKEATGGIVVWLNSTAPVEDLAVIADAVVPVLVVVDYAESRPKQLAALLIALATRRRAPTVKVLALARTDGYWWDQLADTSDAVATLLESATLIALPVLDATDAARQDGYRAAVAAFAEEMAQLPGHTETDWPGRAAALADRPLPSTMVGGTVLAIQMTALADLLDASSGHGGSEGSGPEATASGRGAGRRRSPEERVYRHERRYWRSTAEAVGVFPALTMDALADTVAATVLVLPPTPAQVNEWFARIPGLSDQPLDRRDRIRTWLASLYPAAGPYAFGQLEPDRLAEHMIGTLIADQRRTSIAETLARHVDGEDATRWVSICARAAAHPGLGNPVGELLTRMMGTHPKSVAVAALDVATTLEAPKALVHALERLVRDPATPTASLTNVADALPTHSLLWGNTAAMLLDVLAARSQPEEPDESVGQDRQLMDPLGADRIEFVNGAIWIMNQAAASVGGRIDWARSDLASTLVNQACRLAAVGRVAEALAKSAEAVQIYRRLAEGPAGHQLPGEDREVGVLSGLACSLGNHSNYLAAVGRAEEALAAITEAVQIFRRLAESRPDAFLPQVARSLNSYSTALAAVGRREEALAAITEAVQIFRRLAESRPDAFLPDIARTLGNYGTSLADSGQREEALVAFTEAVQIFRRLAESRPDAFLPEFARSLSNHSNALADLDRPKDALASSTQAVQIYRQLVEAGHDALLPGFAMSLHNHSRALAVSGHWKDCLAASTEAVQIYRRLAEGQDAKRLSDLAEGLNNRALALAALGRTEQGLTASAEAIQIFEQLARSRPDAFLLELARSLNKRASIAESVGWISEALANAERAVAILEGLAEQNWATYLPVLADSVKNVATWSAKSGRRGEAVAASERAVALYEELAEGDPDSHLPTLAVCADNVAVLLCEVGRPSEAIIMFRLAVAVGEKLAKANRAKYLLLLAVSADRLAIQLGELKRYPEAVVAAKRAVAVREEMTGVDRAAHLPALTASVNNLALWLSHVGRRPEALAAAKQVVGFYEELTEADRATYLPDLARAVRSLAADLRKADLRDEAVTAAERAVSCYEELADGDRVAYQLDLARSVDSLAADLAEAGRRSEALAASERAVAMLRELVEADRASHLPALARSLWTAVYVRRTLATDHVAALDRCDEAITLYRELTNKEPNAFRDPLRAVEALRDRLLNTEF